jgi:twitching motility protein PilT
MSDLLQLVVAEGASDLHLRVGVPPVIRLHGILHRVEGPACTNEDTEELMRSIASDDHVQQVRERGTADFGFAFGDMARFRVSIFKERGQFAAVLRLIPNKLLTLEQIGLPRQTIMNLLYKPRGLILVTGPTGSGKSTTLAAMIDKINREWKGHIITVEDPIEFIHRHQGCIVNQREVGTDTKSFSNALKYALREDPDVVLIGEMRDLETIQAGLTIAETGHLAFATLHTNSAAETINRIIDVFPSHQQSQVRAQLAFVLEGIITQTLLPKAKGRGRVMACEILVATPAIRALIRDDKVHQIQSSMQAGKKHGMQTLNDSLYALYMNREVVLEDCLRSTSEPNEFLRMVGEPVPGEDPPTAPKDRPLTGGLKR